MSTITVVAKIVAKEEFIHPVKVELLKMVAPTRQEKGCIEYRLHQDNQNPALFFFYESWESQTFLNQHLETPHYKNYAMAIKELISDKVVNFMTFIGE